ncbi:MAG: GTPase involved in ribosome synthesis and maintenance [Pseudomonadota bacterium]|jgi:GTP-binding protein
MPESSARPIIAIIGRPNVGKSTLFNRMVGKRLALVSDMPGLTRDRREGEAEVAGHRVTVVDTAGLEEGAAGSIPERMRRQTETAIAEADLVLFVIDSREGVTPADQAFGRLVRASGRPTILVANKSEGRRGFDGVYEAFELGLGEPVPISAEHGEGLADLDIDIEAALGLKPVVRSKDASVAGEGEAAEDAAPVELRPIRIAIAGRPNVGKSTLVNGLLGEDRMITGPEPGLTRDAIASDLEWQGRTLRLFDTAGLRRKTKVDPGAEHLSVGDTLRAIKFAEVVILVIDAERGLEHQDLTIGDLVAREGRGLVLALNKWDLVANKQQFLKEMRETLAERLSQVAGVSLVPISALAERNLDKLLKAVLDAYAVWNKRVPTPDLNKWLQEATDRHPPPAVRGRHIRIRFITQPSARPPTFIAFSQRAERLPDSYLRYLTNSLRQAFDFPGTPIRFNFRKAENPYAKRK